MNPQGESSPARPEKRPGEAASKGCTVRRGHPILIVDDHGLLSTSLRVALRRHGLDVHETRIVSAATVVDHARALRPGLVVLDLHLGHDSDGHLIDGVELVGPLRRLGCRVLIVSGSQDQPSEAAAIAAGALGVVPKSASFPTLLDAIRSANVGRPVMSDGVRQAWLRYHDEHQAQQRERTRRLDRLSERESQVLQLLAQGMRAADIAARFVVSMTTVRTQIRSILAKLDVTSQLEAVALFSNRQPRP